MTHAHVRANSLTKATWHKHVVIGVLLHTALRPEQVIASPNIIETKKVKQNKTEKLVSNEEENPEKANNETNK